MDNNSESWKGLSKGVWFILSVGMDLGEVLSGKRVDKSRYLNTKMMIKWKYILQETSFGKISIVMEQLSNLLEENKKAVIGIATWLMEDLVHNQMQSKSLQMDLRYFIEYDMSGRVCCYKQTLTIEYKRWKIV